MQSASLAGPRPRSPPPPHLYMLRLPPAMRRGAGAARALAPAAAVATAVAWKRPALIGGGGVGAGPALAPPRCRWLRRPTILAPVPPHLCLLRLAALSARCVVFPQSELLQAACGGVAAPSLVAGCARRTRLGVAAAGEACACGCCAPPLAACHRVAASHAWGVHSRGAHSARTPGSRRIHVCIRSRRRPPYILRGPESCAPASLGRGTSKPRLSG
ncbi:MAG: hypothetical protein J3K34DRAFT_229402 [Monoraphidium minutum]|nr:MAG: hypothetical protein J3K34DRAFT_229402 [Monoraphidium minutum]